MRNFQIAAFFSLRSFIVAPTFKFTLIKPRFHVLVLLFEYFGMLILGQEKKLQLAYTGMDRHNRLFYKQHNSRASASRLGSGRLGFIL